MKKILSNKRGDGYIDIAVAVLVIVFLLVMVISIWSAIVLKQDMQYMCEELVDTATTSGRIGTEVNERYDELCEEVGFEPSLSWNATYFNTSKKQVQFGDSIALTLSHEITLQGFGVFKLPFSVTVTKSGLSRVYWK